MSRRWRAGALGLAAVVSVGLPFGTAASGATQPPVTPVVPHRAIATFVPMERSLPGPVGIAIAPVGYDEVDTFGDDAAAHGWSTTKVLVLAALMKASGTLSAGERQLATTAITESDNQSILDLFGDLEKLEGGTIASASAYMDRFLRASGDGRTEVATAYPPPAGAVTSFGQTEWAPSEAVKFFQMLGRGCLINPGQTRYVLGLMQHIIPSESWGLGQAGFAHIAFKGGWGPESNGAYIVRQSAIIDPGTPDAVAVSMVAHPPPGPDSFSTGIDMLDTAGQWLKRVLVLAPRTGAGCPTPVA